MSHTRLVLSPASRPALVRHVRLRFDETRKAWLLLAPERLMTPSETAVDVLKLCDGQRSIEAIAKALAAEFDAPEDAILGDILPLLQDMADNGYLTA
jgi:pyrroloquinoline quinone biosynthesis protein D